MGNRIPATADTKIVLQQVGADLRVRGWERDEIKFEGDGPRVQISDDQKTVTISTGGDCDISVPERASLEIGAIGADAKITGLHGDLNIDQVGADLSLRDVGSVQIKSVGADLRVRQVSGAVQVDQVGADATLQEVTGNVMIGFVGADALIREVEGTCALNHVGSDLILEIDFKPGNEYHFMAQSDILCRVATDANVQFHIQTPGDVAVNAENGQLVHADEGQQRVVFGEGAAVVKLEANGDVQIIDQDASGPVYQNFEALFDFDFDRVFEDTARVTERARREAERVSAQIQREAERAAEQVRRHAERAAEQARREADRIQRQNKRGFNFEWSFGDGPGRSRRGFGPVPPMPPMPPMPPVPPAPPNPANRPDEPVTMDERLSILRMVESKQISVEEAERLLAALEGRG